MSERNYHRFYASLHCICVGDADDMKATLVSSFTDGRTTHLHEMADEEYSSMCASLEECGGWKSALKKKRSVCLRLMQQLGIDTTDWERVNAFCRNPRIAGNVFGKLGVKDLDALQLKLRAIKNNGGLKPKSKPSGTESASSNCRKNNVEYMMVSLGTMGEA